MTQAALVTLILVPIAYLLGTFPSAEIVARRNGLDIRSKGSGNPGASNVGRLLGWKAFALVFLVDVIKGALAAGVGLWVGGRPGAYALGIAALLGHIFPVWRRFKGGKGVATGAGVMLVLFPIITLVLAVVWVVVARLLHKASLASVAVAVAYPVLAALSRVAWVEVGVLTVLAVLVVGRHWRNLQRIARGEEFGLPR